MADSETRIVQCKKCGLRTRHEWQRWERRSLLSLLIGRVKTIQDWACTKCGRMKARMIVRDVPSSAA